MKPIKAYLTYIGIDHFPDVLKFKLKILLGKRSEINDHMASKLTMVEFPIVLPFIEPRVGIIPSSH